MTERGFIPIDRRTKPPFYVGSLVWEGTAQQVISYAKKCDPFRYAFATRVAFGDICASVFNARGDLLVRVYYRPWDVNNAASGGLFFIAN